MSETTLLESRLSKVEQDNRRLKLALGALLLALAAVPLIGAVMPEQIPELIQAREFRVIDYDGTVRAGMTRETFGLNDARGSARVYADIGGIYVNDEYGVQRTGMDYNGVALWDENRTVRSSIATNGFVNLDKNGLPRAMLSEFGIVYLDEDGNVVWSTPER